MRTRSLSVPLAAVMALSNGCIGDLLPGSKGEPGVAVAVSPDTGVDGTDEDADPSRVCPPWFFARGPDSAREFELDPAWGADDFIGTLQRGVTAWEDRGSETWITVMQVEEGRFVSRDVSRTRTTEQTWVCDAEGAWLVRTSMRATSEEDGEPGPEVALDTLYDGGLLWVPWDADARDGWTSEAPVVYSNEDGSSEGLVRWEVTVTSGREVTVPAGTFEGLHLRRTYGDVELEEVLVPEVGPVLDDGAALTAYAD